MKPNVIGFTLISLGTAGLALVSLATLFAGVPTVAKLAAFGAFVLVVAAICLIAAAFFHVAPRRPIVGRGTTANLEDRK